jgi:biopolymer transport protein ExbD
MRGYLAHTALRERKRRATEGHEVAKLQLTSLIDIFVVLLLFLLKSLVVGGAVVTPFPGVKLPPSSATASFKESPVVVVAADQVVVDGERVCATEDVLHATELRLPEVEGALAAVRQKSESLAQRQGSERRFEGRLILQADESIPFHVLQKVMYTSQTVGFYDITLAVMQEQ